MDDSTLIMQSWPPRRQSFFGSYITSASSWPGCSRAHEMLVMVSSVCRVSYGRFGDVLYSSTRERTR